MFIARGCDSNRLYCILWKHGGPKFCCSKGSCIITACMTLSDTGSLNLHIKLYYNTNVDALTAVLATFSTACFG